MKQPINHIRATLGEGPVWHQGKLIWVNIPACQLMIGDNVIPLAERIGCAWPCANSDQLICGLEFGLALINPNTGEIRDLINPEQDLPRTRFNDGKCDPLGRFWVGTMDMEESEPLGSLYMFDSEKKIHRQWQGVTVSNGLAWDPDGVTFYYIDSPTRSVMAFDYEAASGALSNQRTVIQIPDGEGFPDGMTIDTEGKLWIALWGGWGVVRYDPKTGERLSKIDLPVEKVTSCVFGGDDLDQLFITTASIDLDESALEQQPFAGGVFQVETATKGLAAVPFAGA